MKNLTIIIPAKNEAESLPKVLDDLRNLDCKITISLNKHDIGTINAIKKYNTNIYYQTKKGYGNSLREAINFCDTEYFCIFNADGSFETKDLQKIYALTNNNDFVFTTRYEKPGGSDDDTLITFVGNKVFSKLGNILFSLKISDILYTFLMGKTKSFRKLDIQSDDFGFCVELPIKMQIAEMEYECIPSYEKKRIAGKKKVNAIKDGFLILTEMIKLFIIFKLFRKKIISE